MLTESPAADVMDYLGNASGAIVRCRLYGHPWDPPEDPSEYEVEGKGADRVYTQQITCMRCETTAVDTFDPLTLNRISRTYSYVEGYLRTDHHGPLLRRELRLGLAARKKRVVRSRQQQRRAA